MSQTLLAFLAMMVATMLAFNQYQSQNKTSEYGRTILFKQILGSVDQDDLATVEGIKKVDL